MPWTTPLTAVASAALTAAQWNASVRDNLLETPAAKATAASSHFVGTGPNAIAERFAAEDVVGTSQTTVSTSYTNLATDGPVLTATTGARCLVFVSAQMKHSVTDGVTYVSYEISGATTSGSSDGRAAFSQLAANQDVRMTAVSLATLNPGSNTFRTQYRIGLAGTGTFQLRRLAVFPL